MLLTMGGIPESYAFLSQLQQHRDTCFVVLGAGDCLEQHDNVIVLPYRSTVFPPDLVHACDAVVSKLATASWQRRITPECLLGTSGASASAKGQCSKRTLPPICTVLP